MEKHASSRTGGGTSGAVFLNFLFILAGIASTLFSVVTIWQCTVKTNVLPWLPSEGVENANVKNLFLQLENFSSSRSNMIAAALVLALLALWKAPRWIGLLSLTLCLISVFVLALL